MTICPRSQVNCFILSSFAVVTLPLVSSLRASFRQEVWQAWDHPYLSRRASGNNRPRTLPGLQGDQPWFHASFLFLEPTPLACLEVGGQAGSDLEGWKDRCGSWCRDRSDPGEQSELQLHFTYTRDEPWGSPASAEAVQAPALPTCTAWARKPQGREFCNMPPWQHAEGSRDLNSIHPFNTWNRLFRSHSSAYISFAPPCCVNIRA